MLRAYARNRFGPSPARWWRVIPATVVVYIIAYMDRVNIGFATAGGMDKALGLTLFTSGLAAGIFFWGYLALQVPGGHIAEHGSGKRFIFWTILGWAGVSLLTGFVRNGWELVIMRFLLGVAEGGVYPAILVLIGNWFPQKEIGRANALFLTSLPLSAAVTNPVSGWVVDHYSWRALFYLEGVVSFATLLVWMPLVSDRPSSAPWISAEERDYLESTLSAEKARREAAPPASGSAQAGYGRLLADQNLWIMIGLYLCYTTGQYGYLLWLPSILKDLTRQSLTSVGWLSAPPLVAAIAGVYIFGAASDVKGNRRLWCAVSLWGFGVALGLVTVFAHRVWIAYSMIVVAGLLSKGMQSPFWSSPALVFAPGVVGGARGVINGIGNLGGFVGPVLVGWIARETGGNMNYGMAALAVSLIAGGCLTMLLPKATAGYEFQKERAAATSK